MEHDEHERLHELGIAHEHDHDHAHGHKHPHVHENQKLVSNRLARAIGHLQKVKRMVDESEDCSEALIQLAAVRAALEGTQDEQRIQAAGAGDANDLDVCRILEPVRAGQIRARVGAPVAAEGHDGRTVFTYLHIASTSARIC